MPCTDLEASGQDAVTVLLTSDDRSREYGSHIEVVVVSIKKRMVSGQVKVLPVHLYCGSSTGVSEGQQLERMQQQKQQTRGDRANSAIHTYSSRYKQGVLNGHG